MSQLLIKRGALYSTTRRRNPCLELPPNCWHLCQPGKSELLPCGTRACAITMAGSAQVSEREAGRCVPCAAAALPYVGIPIRYDLFVVTLCTVPLKLAGFHFCTPCVYFPVKGGWKGLINWYRWSATVSWYQWGGSHRVECSSLQFNERFFSIPWQTDDIITVNALNLLFYNVSSPTKLTLRYF